MHFLSVFSGTVYTLSVGSVDRHSGLVGWSIDIILQARVFSLDQSTGWASLLERNCKNLFVTVINGNATSARFAILAFCLFSSLCVTRTGTRQISFVHRCDSLWKLSIREMGILLPYHQRYRPVQSIMAFPLLPTNASRFYSMEARTLTLNTLNGPNSDPVGVRGDWQYK